MMGEPGTRIATLSWPPVMKSAALEERERTSVIGPGQNSFIKERAKEGTFLTHAMAASSLRT